MLVTMLTATIQRQGTLLAAHPAADLCPPMKDTPPHEQFERAINSIYANSLVKKNNGISPMPLIYKDS
jgi:hypothetical protein